MWQEILQIFKSGFYQYGAECISYFVVAMCFRMFYIHGTQRQRFRLIGNACLIMGIGSALFFVLPVLKIMNPQFEISNKGYLFLGTLIGCISISFLWASLFVQELGNKQLKFLLIALSLVLISIFVPVVLYTKFSFTYLLLGVSWLIVAISFHRLPTVGKTSFFWIIGDCLLLLSAFYFARQFHWLPEYGLISIVLFLCLSIVVVMAQIKFMQHSSVILEEQLEFEKKRRTMFWDIAPFPILVSKLLDDSVLYINSVARDMLKLSNDDITKFRLKDYFSDLEKRNELVEKVRQNRIVDSFEVEMCSPRMGEKMWLDLSARVVELDGELALYINLHNMTEQKETEERLFKQASTDTLTGLYNRRQFEAMVAQAVASSKRNQTPYCVMMSDIDHFKSVNDTYGHEAGDIVLKEVANLMKTTFRSSDIIGRFGGEEFVIFFNNTDLEGAKIAAEKFRQAVEQAYIEAEGQHIPVTISLGITNTQNDDLLRLVKEADLALYYSKEHGRNQVSVYTPQLEQSKVEQ